MNQKFDYIFFTGGVAVGKEVMAKAAKHLTPVTLELGGKSPCIVDKSANLELAAKRIVFGKFLNCGQTCVAPDYILCEREIKERFVSEVIKQIKLQYGENPLENKDYGKIYLMVGINELGHNREQAVAKFGELISLIETTQPGATIYICANLHVTESRSKTDAIINNDNINSYNKALSAFADGENKFYIDVNPVFDDMSGSLSEDYASDSAHMEAQHYDMWCDWLMEQAVVKTYQ